MEININKKCTKRTLAYCLVISGLLSGCNLLPGMHNLNTTQMAKVLHKEQIKVTPTLIPITPTLIADQKISTYFYKVAPADVLNIIVWEHPEFHIESAGITTGSSSSQGAAGQAGYLVNSHGAIYFPLVGYVNVANKTVDEIRNNITVRLKKYVPNPQVNVRVADFRGQKIYVLGEVNRNGFLPITDQRLTLTDALSLSGWINPETADPSSIYVIRGDFRCPKIFWLNATTPDKLLLGQRFSMQPKDILYVSSAPVTNWNRVLSQILPSVQPVMYTQAFVNYAFS